MNNKIASLLLTITPFAKKLKLVFLTSFLFLFVACSSDSGDSGGSGGTTNPDLNIAAFTVSPTSISSGGNTTLLAVVRNSGGVNSGDATLRFYRSSDSNITASDTEITTNSISSLSGGGISLETATVNVHSSGTMYYGVCVDSVANESNTGNNCGGGVAVSVTPAVTSPPDLSISSFTTNGATISFGDNITLTALVRNRGGSSSAETTLRYYRSKNDIITADDTLLNTVSVSTIVADGTSGEIATVTGHSSGTYYYGVCVDFVSGEINSSNNCSDGVAVTVLPSDLGIASFSANPTTILPGGPITISATVKNSGKGSSGATTLRYYRSTDSTIDASDTEITTDAFSSLVANGTSNESATITGHISGTYYYGVCVDSVAGESSTDNNCGGGIAVKSFPFFNTDNISDTNTFNLDGASSVTTATIGIETYLFVAGQNDNGISSFKRFISGNLNTFTNVDNVGDTNTFNLDGARSMATAQVGSNNYLFVAGYDEDGISSFRILDSGYLSRENTVSSSDNANLELDGASSVTTAWVGSKTYLFVAGYDDDGISSFEVGEGGSLTNTVNISDGGNLELDGASSVTTALVEGKTFLFVAGEDDDGVSSFEVSSDGMLINRDNVSDNGTFNLDGAKSVTTAQMAGKTYLFVAGEDDNGVSVFDVSADGSLTNRDNVSDSGSLELGGATSVTTAQISGKTYLFVAGANDDGVSVFEVSKNGMLTNIYNVSDNTTLELSGVRSVTVSQIADKTFLFVAGVSDDGVSVFEMDGAGNSTSSDAKEIRLGQSYSDNLRAVPRGQQNNNYYRVYLFTGNYTISTTTSIYNTATDTYCYLYSASDTTNHLRRVDDGGEPQRNCSFTYNVTTAGYYYIRVRGYSASTGNYTLQIRR